MNRLPGSTCPHRIALRLNNYGTMLFKAGCLEDATAFFSDAVSMVKTSLGTDDLSKERLAQTASRKLEMTSNHIQSSSSGTDLELGVVIDEDCSMLPYLVHTKEPEEILIAISFSEDSISADDVSETRDINYDSAVILYNLALTYICTSKSETKISQQNDRPSRSSSLQRAIKLLELSHSLLAGNNGETMVLTRVLNGLTLVLTNLGYVYHSTGDKARCQAIQEGTKDLKKIINELEQIGVLGSPTSCSTAPAA